MKKFIVVLLIAGFLALYLVRRASEKYQQVENNLYNVRQSNSAERLGFVGPEVGQKSGTNHPPVAVPSPPASAPSTGPAPAGGVQGAGVVSAGKVDQPDLVICTREIPAYDPSHPTKQIGKFLKDTQLTIGPKDSLSDLYFVTFRPPTGKAMRALCRAEDLGR